MLLETTSNPIADNSFFQDYENDLINKFKESDCIGVDLMMGFYNAIFSYGVAEFIKGKGSDEKISEFCNPILLDIVINGKQYDYFNNLTDFANQLFMVRLLQKFENNKLIELQLLKRANEVQSLLSAILKLPPKERVIFLFALTFDENRIEKELTLLSIFQIKTIKKNACTSLRQKMQGVNNERFFDAFIHCSGMFIDIKVPTFKDLIETVKERN
jgi:hypothetical protein